MKIQTVSVGQITTLVVIVMQMVLVVVMVDTPDVIVESAHVRATIIVDLIPERIHPEGEEVPEMADSQEIPME